MLDNTKCLPFLEKMDKGNRLAAVVIITTELEGGGRVCSYIQSFCRAACMTTAVSLAVVSETYKPHLISEWKIDSKARFTLKSYPSPWRWC